MHISVGHRFDPRLGRWPEATHYGWDPGHAPAPMHALTVFAERPTPAERTAFSRGGRVELALVVSSPAIALLWRGAGWPRWSDGHFSWHALPVERRALPSVGDIADGTGVPLQMVLVDAADGIVRAIRVVAMPGTFARELHRAIVAQAEAPYDAAAYDAEVRRITDADLDALARDAVARCTLGGGR